MEMIMTKKIRGNYLIGYGFYRGVEFSKKYAEEGMF